MKQLFGSVLLSFALISSTYAYKDKKVAVDAKSSTIEWHAKKVTGTHHGTVPLVSGSLVVDNGILKGGTFLIDVKSLVVVDIKDHDMNGKLTNHLKSEDFFGVEKFPQAQLVITGVNAKGAGEYEVSGDLTIKGKTEAVKFPAAVKTEGGKLVSTAKISVDRTKYDIKFRSANFFENLGDKAIMDDFILEVKLVADL